MKNIVLASIAAVILSSSIPAVMLSSPSAVAQETAGGKEDLEVPAFTCAGSVEVSQGGAQAVLIVAALLAREAQNSDLSKSQIAKMKELSRKTLEAVNIMSESIDFISTNENLCGLSEEVVSNFRNLVADYKTIAGIVESIPN